MQQTIRRLFLQRHSRYEKRFARQFKRAIRNQILTFEPEQLPTNELEKVYRDMYLYIMAREGQITWNTYVTDQPPIKQKDLLDSMADALAPEDEQKLQDFWKDLMTGYLSLYIQTRLLQVTDTTKRQMYLVMEQGRDQGLNDTEIRNKLQAHARSQQLRANTISRTETTNAMNRSQTLALKSSESEWQKAWDAIRDEATRDAHFNTDPTVWIDMEDAFEVGGEYLNYPGDITMGATAGNVVNCRCSLLFRKKGGKFGFRRRM